LTGSNLRRMAEELLTLGAVRDAVDAEYKARRATLQAEYEELGLERQRITTADDMEFGVVVLANGSVVVEVVDHDAMIDWLESNRPDMIKTRHDIDPTYWRVLAEAARSAGAGVDPATGQRLDWIRVSVGAKSLRATPTRDAKQAVKAAIQQTGVQFAIEATDD
jgi:hypothetical protein